MSKEFDAARRELLLRKFPGAVLLANRLIADVPRTLAAGVVSTALVACQPEPEDNTGPLEMFSWKERAREAMRGDVVIVDNKPYLLGDNRRYLIPDLERYAKNSKLMDYGGRVFTSSTEGQRQLPIVNPADYSSILSWLVELNPDSQGKDSVKRRLDNKLRYGGEMLVFFPGFMTDDGIVYDIAKPRLDTFVTLVKGLAPSNWGFEDCVFFNYGQKLWIDNYHTKDTGRPPEENARFARNFLRALKEELPLVRFNVVGHSLGAVMALSATMEHYDRINNLVLVNGPVNGIEETIARRALIETLRNTYFRLYGLEDERTTSFLFNLWRKPQHRNQVEKFISFLNLIKRGTLVVLDEGDDIVPPESAYVSSSEVLRVKFREEEIPPYDIKEKIDNLLKKHGRPLKYEQSIRRIGEKIGQDLADAA